MVEEKYMDPQILRFIKDHEITVLLVDDQPIIGEAVRRMLEPEADIKFHYCQEATKAQDSALEVNPTVILQDLVMPDIDGMTLVKKFRERKETRDIPLVVLSSEEDATVKAEAFSNGANDYMVKLPHRLELIARIRYHSAAYINMLERNETYKALEASLEVLAGEMKSAADYVVSLLPSPQEAPFKVSWKYQPSMQLGGDSFGYHWFDEDNFVVYLLDVCGHGVGAALLGVTIANVLRSQSLPGVDFLQPDQVLCELNEKFPSERQNGMFFTIWYGVYNRTTGALTYATGGHPPALLMRDDGGTRETMKLAADGIIIGGMPRQTFKSESITLKSGDRLLVYSDGVYEIDRPDGTMWDISDFFNLLESMELEAGESAVGKIFNEVGMVRGKKDFDDDFSMVEVIFP